MDNEIARICKDLLEERAELFKLIEDILSSCEIAEQKKEIKEFTNTDLDNLLYTVARKRYTKQSWEDNVYLSKDMVDKILKKEES